MSSDSTPGSHHGSLRWFLGYLKPYRGWLAAATAVGVVKYNLPVVFPWILKDLIDHGFHGHPGLGGLSFDALMELSVLLFIAYAAVTYARSLLADRLAQRMICDVRTDLFRHLQQLSADFFQRHQTGTVSARLFTDVNSAQTFVGLAGTNVFMDLTCLASITAVVFSLNWRLAFVAFSTVPLFFWLQRRLGRQMHRNSYEARRRLDHLQGRAQEAIAGVMEIKSCTREREELREFDERSAYFLEAMFQNVRIYGGSLASTALLTRIPPVLVLWLGGHYVLSGQLTIGSLVAFYAYLEMIFGPLNRLGELNAQLAGARAAIDRLFEFFQVTPERQYAQSNPLHIGRGRIEYRRVRFGYEPGRLVFKELTVSIAPGERVALVGRSGAGKSTFTKLLVRFYELWGGQILIDGQDIAEVSLASLRSQIAYVQQEPVLFSGTLEENIRFGRPGASPREVQAAAEQANLGPVLEELGAGLQSLVGERGVRLAGGQRQRVALARAFLKDAPILIMDESTSNLDSPSENLIYEALRRLSSGRTTLLIAHRLATVAQADRVLVFAEGGIVQEGSPEKLLEEKDGAFFMLHRDAARTELIGG